MIDEHYYAPPKWFLDNATRYDYYDRNGPIVFAGEYAAHGPDKQAPTSRNTWLSALAEAAFMTGLERNADIVHLASYAPLLAHVDAWQWRPNLIWFDNLRVMTTPNYYVQQLYSTNLGTHVLPISAENQVIVGEDSLYASAVFNQNTKEVIIKMVNASVQSAEIQIDLKGAVLADNTIHTQMLSCNRLLDYNTLDDMKNIHPIQGKQNTSGSAISIVLNPQTFIVVKASVKDE